MSENIDGEEIADETPVTENADTAENESAPEVSAVSGGEAVATTKYRNKFLQKLDSFFGISKAGSNFRLEIIGGITTFMAMVYILMVNANMFANPDVLFFGEDGKTVEAIWNVFGAHAPADFEAAKNAAYGAVYIATALSAIIGTMLMALLARLPMAQASGMGLNAFFVYTICLGSNLTYANTLLLVFIEGLVFIVLTVTGLRKMLFNAIPKAVRIAIPAGIGLFIAFIGLQNAGIVVLNSSTKVSLVSLNLLQLPKNQAYGIVMPVFITIAAVIAIAVLAKKGKKGAILWSILGATALYWAIMGIGYAWKDVACVQLFDNFHMDNPGTAFVNWGKMSVGQVFTKGLDFSAYLAMEGNNGGTLTLVIITSALAFCMVDMFDTMGTLYGAAARGNMLDAEGNVPNMNKAMLCDAIATSTGAICGTSTVTTFVESSSGIGAGARTGFASLITSACFLVAMFLSPIAQLIPSAATAAALIYVGVLMMNCVKEIEWTDAAEAVPAFFTIAMMPFTYNISYGIAFGIISYLLIKLCTGKIKDIHPVTVVIGALFMLMFLLTH